MVQETISRATSLAIAAIVFTIYCVVDIPLESVGIIQGASPWQRLAYPFFHASFLHVFMNVWCMLSVVFVYPITIWSLLIAFLISASFPVDTLHAISPIFGFSVATVGLSGVCFALMGRISFMVRRKLYYQSWLAFYLLLGFLMPNVNGYLHLYCYMMGVFVGFLNKPIR